MSISKLEKLFDDVDMSLSFIDEMPIFELDESFTRERINKEVIPGVGECLTYRVRVGDVFVGPVVEIFMWVNQDRWGVTVLSPAIDLIPEYLVKNEDLFYPAGQIVGLFDDSTVDATFKNAKAELDAYEQYRSKSIYSLNDDVEFHAELYPRAVILAVRLAGLMDSFSMVKKRWLEEQSRQWL